MNTRSYVLYPMLRAAIMLIVGLIVGHTFPSEGMWLATLSGIIILSVALMKHCIAQSVVLSLTWLSLGGFLMSRAVADMNVALPNEDIEYEAVITSEPTIHGKVLMADILILNGEEGLKAKASFLRDTTYNQWQALQVGTGIRARSLLVKPTNYRGGTFDYARYLKEHGYRACTYIYKDKWQAAELDIRKLSAFDRTVLLAKRFRHVLLKRLQAMGMEGKDYAVVAALTLGEKSFLTKDIKDDYSISGASHVLALSGLHLGIVYALLNFLMLGWRKQWAAQLLSITLVWAYVVLVGFSPSVVRSAVMLTIFALVTLANENTLSLNTLALTAVIMLITNPLTLYDIGFQMSFLAVLGILVFLPFFRKLISRKILYSHRVLTGIWNMIAVSLSAQILIFPIVIYYFGRFSCYFLLSNFIAIPCATALLYGVVLLVPLAFVPYMGSLMAAILSYLVRFMNSVLQFIASLPGASIENIRWNTGQVIAVYVVIGCLYWLLKLAKRHRIMYENLDNSVD